MKAVILQSNYIPWKGYFDLISNADVCVFLDSVQFTKNDWRNRNRILSGKGDDIWLSIPVGQSISRKIMDVELPQNDWGKRHLSTFKAHYGKAPNFSRAYETLSDEIESTPKLLSSLNQKLIERITREYFHPSIEFVNDYDLLDDVPSLERNQRIISILKAVEATEYISGPSASSYIDDKRYKSENISIRYANYEGYPKYSQNGSIFRDDISILDLISWNGNSSIDFLKREELLVS